MRRALAAVGLGAAVVVHHAVGGGADLHAHDWDDEQPDEHVQREHAAHVPHGDALHGECDEQHSTQCAGEARVRLDAEIPSSFHRAEARTARRSRSSDRAHFYRTPTFVAL